MSREDDLERQRSYLTERAQLAATLDVELQAACRAEAAVRHELGIAARELLRSRGYHRLGFVSVSDYARERLGISARTLQSAAWVATRLDNLPLVATAFDRSELTWTQVRALCAAARVDDQAQWLARARETTVDELERLAEAAPRETGVPPDPDSNDGMIEGEPTLRLRIACPARVRALWRRAVELATRVAGEPLSAWRSAECIAAEAVSGRPAGAPVAERALFAYMRLVRRVGRESSASAPSRPPDPAAPFLAAVTPVARAEITPGFSDTVASGSSSSAGHSSALASSATVVSLPRVASNTPNGSASPDPFALDARLVAAVHVIRTTEPRIGRLLRLFHDRKLYRVHGYGALADYVRERLGLSIRKVWALLKVEKSTWRSEELARAYAAGTISWVGALTLLPVLDRENAGAWIARANLVSVRRLTDEVNWALETHDAHGATTRLDPPPLDSPLPSAVTVGRSALPAAPVQIGALQGGTEAVTNLDTRRRAALEVCDVEIAFTAPVSVVTLFREALDAFQRPGNPRWLALANILEHVITFWEASPRPRDPIFARDNWRCTVPACSSRRNLHDHHLVFRSQGGTNDHTNRTAVCAAHHLHGIHAGTVCASGTAPGAIYWQLGVRAGRPPLLAYLGDRRCAENIVTPVASPVAVTQQIGAM